MRRNVLWVVALVIVVFLGGMEIASEIERRILNHPMKQKLLELSAHVIDIGSPVLSLAVSVDGKWVACGSRDSLIRVWDISSKRLHKTLSGHTQAVTALSFNHVDFAELASGSMDKSVRIWDCNTGTGAVITPFISPSDVASIVFNPTSPTELAIASIDKVVRLWDVTKGHTQSLSGHTDQAVALAFTADGKALISGSWDRSIKIWDVAQRNLVKTLTGDCPITALAANPVNNDQFVSGGWDKKLRIWSLRNGTDVALEGHSNRIQSVAYSSDGARIASGSDFVVPGEPLPGQRVPQCQGLQGGIDVPVRLWDVTTRTIVPLPGHTHSVRAVCFSPTSPLLISGSLDQTIRIWDLSLINDVVDFFRILALDARKVELGIMKGIDAVRVKKTVQLLDHINTSIQNGMTYKTKLLEDVFARLPLKIRMALAPYVEK